MERRLVDGSEDGKRAVESSKMLDVVEVLNGIAVNGNRCVEG